MKPAVLLIIGAMLCYGAAPRKKTHRKVRPKIPPIVYQGSGEIISAEDLQELKETFRKVWKRALPITADGESETHERMGFDHTGRVDVGVQPMSVEGYWIRKWLKGRRVPFIAFRRAKKGIATGPHIHIGPASERLAKEVRTYGTGG